MSLLGGRFGPRIPRSSWVAVLVSIVAVAAAWQNTDGAIFSPGPLAAADSTPTLLGNVTAHDQLSRRCGACHTAPWAAATMDAQCEACHTDIQAEQRDSTALHAAVASTTRCVACHTEHRGRTTTRTSFAGFAIQHERLGFALDGAHAAVTCEECHTPRDGRMRFTNTPSTCVGCHQADDTHKGTLGEDCAACHSTATWTGATIRHDAFPLDHGSREPVPCATCHTNSANYKVYTCYGCHAHDPARVARQHRGEVQATNLDNCLRCHAGGREHGERRGHDG
jgi:hypothetical protein